MPRSHRRLIPVAEPDLSGREEEYVLDCVRSTWISSRGEYIERFEHDFRARCGSRHAISCTNGTAALHLALLALGIGPGDEVIVPALTFIASANAVRYCGATPRFADSKADTWNIDPDSVARLVTPATRAIMPVHLFGNPAALNELAAVAADVPLVEDAAEAHGARYEGRHAGSLGAVGTFSFYGNKIVTTGEGGMVVTDDDELAERVALFRSQGQAPGRTYWFPVVGFNYRMTNIEAAIGVAQLETLDAKLERRRAVAARYRSALEDVPGIEFQAVEPRGESAHWMVGVVLPVEGETDRDAVAADLGDDGVETRPFFYPLHSMPPYASGGDACPVATDIAARGLCLPTFGGLSDADVDYVCERLSAAVARRAHQQSAFRS
jgi:perosamine synthetase